MEIDWNKAPIWADRQGVVSVNDAPVWFNAEQYTYVDGQQRHRVFNFVAQEGYQKHDISSVTKRPVDQPWSGEGLPPVGTVCEHRTGHGMNWSKAQVLAFGEKKVFYRDRDGHEWSRPYDEIEFRPILTPEQIAAEEREKAIGEMAEHMAGYKDVEEANERMVSLSTYLYDHGYRKQPTDQ